MPGELDDGHLHAEADPEEGQLHLAGGFFGPSAGIEEAVWVSATEFVLAGIIRNDNGDPMPFLLWGNSQQKTIRWYESSIIRPQSMNYEASGLAKLKIDEWE